MMPRAKTSKRWSVAAYRQTNWKWSHIVYSPRNRGNAACKQFNVSSYISTVRYRVGASGSSGSFNGHSTNNGWHCFTCRNIRGKEKVDLINYSRNHSAHWVATYKRYGLGSIKLKYYTREDCIAVHKFTIERKLSQNKKNYLCINWIWTKYYDLDRCTSRKVYD